MLELGGNDAAIVLDDVDPKEIAHDSPQYDEICEELGRFAGEIRRRW